MGAKSRDWKRRNGKRKEDKQKGNDEKGEGVPKEISSINQEIAAIQKNTKDLQVVPESVREDCNWSTQMEQLKKKKEMLLESKQNFRPVEPQKGGSRRVCDENAKYA